jgi:hypothetical protein
MKAFMVYISWEMLVLYLVTAGMYVAFTGILVVLLWMRGDAIASVALAPIVFISWIGLLGQVVHVAEASADMRRYLNRD